MSENINNLELVKKLNIFQRILGVQRDANNVVRDEENKFQKYDYFQEEQVLNILKPLFEKYRLLVMISDDDSREYIHEKEGNSHSVKYWKKMEIVNVDIPAETKIFKFFACGSNQDLAKAKGSAETYAMKYMLTKFFLMRILGKDDPDSKDTSK